MGVALWRRTWRTECEGGRGKEGGRGGEEVVLLLEE